MSITARHGSSILQDTSTVRWLVGSAQVETACACTYSRACAHRYRTPTPSFDHEGALYYDYFLTLEDEIRLVWNTPFSAATVLYLIVRYGVLIDMALGMVLIVRPNTGEGLGFSSKG